MEIFIPRGEPMPEIDSVIMGRIPLSAHGFTGLHEAVKYLSDYSLQLEMVRQVSNRPFSLIRESDVVKPALQCHQVTAQADQYLYLRFYFMTYVEFCHHRRNQFSY